MEAVAEKLEEPKKKRTRKQATKKEDAPEVDHEVMVRALAVYGFIFTAEQIAGWTPENIEDLRYKLNAWETWRPGEERSEVPQWLMAWDNPPAETTDEAKAVGTEWRKFNPDEKASDSNPWPIGTRIHTAWSEGATAEPVIAPVVEKAPEAVAAVAVAPIELTQQSAEALEVLRLRRQMSELLNNQGLRVTPREYAALEVAHKLANLTPDVNEAEKEYQEAKSIADGKKKKWEGLQKQMQQVSTELTSTLSDGEYQPTLFQQPYRGDTHYEPQVCIAPSTPVVAVAEAAPKVAEPVVPVTPVDVGGEMDLDCLQKKKLQELTGCSSEFGLSANQVEKLKDTVGTTVKHLEKFQAETFCWEQAIPCFGEKAITKLQDAHLAFRIKFDVPELITAKPAIAPAEQAQNEAEKPSEPAAESQSLKTPVLSDASNGEVGGDTLTVPDVNPEA